MTLEARFWAKVEDTTPGTCWLWSGARTSAGYGLILDRGKLRLAHRVSYEMAYGLIPNGLEVDHLCRVLLCVNPKDLEAVTHQENVLRGEAGASYRERNQCNSGHPYTMENTRIRSSDGTRVCRTCATLYRQRFRERQAKCWRDNHVVQD